MVYNTHHNMKFQQATVEHKKKKTNEQIIFVQMQNYVSIKTNIIKNNFIKHSLIHLIPFPGSRGISIPPIL